MRLRDAPKTLAALTFAVLLAAGLAAAAGCGSQPRTYAPLEAEQFQPLVDTGGMVILSSDQRKLIGEHGYPSHFFITMDSLTGDRIETWTYFPLKEAYTFADGRKLRSEAVEDESAGYPPTTLKPEDFSAALTLDEAGAMLGKPFYSSAAQGEDGDGIIILFYDGATLDYANGSLSGVDTMVHHFEDFPEELQSQ